MGRLSNPPEVLDRAHEQGLYPAVPTRGGPTTTVIGTTDELQIRVQNNLGRLSNPVQRRLSSWEIEKMVWSYAGGDSIHDLARGFSVHRTTVIHCGDLSVIPRRNVSRKLTDARVAQAISRYVAGLPLATVAMEFDIHPRTLRQEFV
jgi:hypothetical protein